MNYSFSGSCIYRVPLIFPATIFAKNRNLLVSPSNSRIIGDPFIQLAAVDSTNNYAMAQIHNGLAQHGSTWFALNQTAGKGQRGRHWNAEEGMNILQTTVMDASAFHLSNPFVLTMVVANACYDFFTAYAGDETRIKWPNDVYWRDRKAGGILIENVVRGSKWLWALVGTGINVNQTSFNDLPNPVSLKQITGKTYDTVTLGKELCSHLDKHYQHYLDHGAQPVHELYNSRLYKKGEKTTMKKDNIVFDCTVAGVSMNGDLLVNDCSWDHFSFGEVEWVM